MILTSKYGLNITDNTTELFKTYYLVIHIFNIEYCKMGWSDLNHYENKLGQAQLKLGLDFTLIFCGFGVSIFGLVELVW